MHPIFCAHLIIFLGLLNLDIITSTPPLECLHCLFVCNLQFILISFFHIQTLHNDCSTIEDVHRRGRSRVEFGLVFKKEDAAGQGLLLLFIPAQMRELF